MSEEQETGDFQWSSTGEQESSDRGHASEPVWQVDNSAVSNISTDSKTEGPASAPTGRETEAGPSDRPSQSAVKQAESFTEKNFNE